MLNETAEAETSNHAELEQQKTYTDYPALPPQEPSLLRYTLFGPEGLRPGWGLLLFLLICAVLVQGAIYGAIQLHVLPHPTHTTTASNAPPKPERPEITLLVEGLMVFSSLVATFVMGKIERRSMGSYGFSNRGFAGLFSKGCLWGLAFLTALVAILWKTGLLVFDGRLLFGAEALKFAAIWLAGFGLVAVAEESLLRGYVQVTLGRGLGSLYKLLFSSTPTARTRTLGFWTAAALLSFVFGAGHGSNPGESPIGLLSAGLIGLVFCLTLWRTGSLWWAIGFHAAWDWAQSFVFGVADSGMMAQGHLLATHPAGKVLWSGGGTGPEGSVFVLLIVALITGVVLWTLPHREVELGL